MDRLRRSEVLLPAASDFPGEFTGDTESARRFKERIFRHLGIDRVEIDLVVPDTHQQCV